MAYNSRPSLLALLFTFNILLAITGQAFAGRDILTNSNNGDMKQPEWFKEHWLKEHDGSFLIPGIGRVMVPSMGGSGGAGSGGTGSLGGGSDGSIGSSGGSSGSYVPGGDDTLVPNPGVEVPAGGGSVPTPSLT